jgi:hypothetical protein
LPFAVPRWWRADGRMRQNYGQRALNAFQKLPGRKRIFLGDASKRG